MSIVVRFHPTNATKEKYDESMRRMEAAGIWPNPPGLEVHVAFGPDDDLRVSEIWSSREEFEAYGEKLMPILSDIGIEFSAEPEIFEVQNLVKQEDARAREGPLRRALVFQGDPDLARSRPRSRAFLRSRLGHADAGSPPPRGRRGRVLTEVPCASRAFRVLEASLTRASAATSIPTN